MLNTKNKKAGINLPMILIILDGWGLGEPGEGNAIYLSPTPVMDEITTKYPYTELYAHGKYVGLPDGQVGNSEAGHMNIGAGRCVVQDSVKISKNIEDGTFYKNSAFLGAIRHVRKMNSRMHLVGMLSNGQSPHSDPGHLVALLDLMRRDGVKDVYLHLFTDGRDSPKYAALKLVEELEKNYLGDYKIATIMGRFYAMDRKKKWSRTEKAFNSLVLGEGRRADNVAAAITESYNRGESDEFMEPYIITGGRDDNTRIREGDSVIFFNLRSDRGRQLAKAFAQHDFNKMNPEAFQRQVKLQHLYFTVMTDFGPDLDDILTAYPSVDLMNTLPMQFSAFKQLYLAETEKYAHVTYFFNGGYTGKVLDETQLMVPSPDVKSYDETPKMSSKELTDIVLKNLGAGRSDKKWLYDFTVLNFAAPDMVGHTGNLAAAKITCEFVDQCVGKIIAAYLKLNGTVVVTADHGNIEKMINYETGEIYTEHTTNHVPFVIVNKKLKSKISLKSSGILGDIAPTILDLFGLKKPAEMTGESLIKQN